MQRSNRLLLLFGLLGALALFPATGARADCKLEVTPPGDFSARQMLNFSRCINRELNRLRRENAKLEERIAELELIAAQMPAAYSNIDGVVEEEPGRAIGRASFVVSARVSGGSSSLPIDQRVLTEVCGESGGCQLSLVFRQFRLFEDAVKEAVISGPCQFIYSPDTGHWVTGEGCNPVGAARGVDGDQRTGAQDATGAIVAEAGGACLFAESAAARSISAAGDVGRDHSMGMFLLSVPQRQPAGIRRFQ